MLLKLHALTSEEKGYLAPYVFGKVNTQYFRVDDGIAGGLTAKLMIYRSSNAFNMIKDVPYNIQPWAKEYLIKNPELLDGAVEPEDAESWRL
ncbi:super-infection exclusion protein B [Methylolobus aquaticus]